MSTVNLYQNWGDFPLKQISSIQFIAPYYHLSTGSTETNCIAPYYVFGKDHWMLPDFRAMSAPLWEGQPQHASVGRLYFLRYTPADGHTVGSESVYNIIDAYGPTYSDIGMNYISDDGKISVDYRHLEFQQWDENRTYYTIELTVNDTEDMTSYVNFSLIIKAAEVTLGGRTVESRWILRESGDGNLNRMDLSMDLGHVTLQKGDRFVIHMILLPWGDPSAENDDNVRAVREDSCLSPYDVTAAVGTEYLEVP